MKPSRNFEFWMAEARVIIRKDLAKMRNESLSPMALP